MTSRLQLEFTSTSFLFFFIPLLLHFTARIAHPGWTNCHSISDRNLDFIFPIGEPRPALRPGQFNIERRLAAFLNQGKAAGS